MKMAGLTAEEQHAISDALNILYAVEISVMNGGGPDLVSRPAAGLRAGLLVAPL